ncbi:VOC family protein [Bacillus sp. EAC]|uniref:VOC family protein n=1 Tax=Bacillus sp. EAC TaxID=1978338 RepID=UPI00211B54D1|nr:hypothetical protein [Bacillus sp. EAC]
MVKRGLNISGLFYFKRIDTVFLYASDFEKAVKWYCTVFLFLLNGMIQQMDTLH